MKFPVFMFGMVALAASLQAQGERANTPESIAAAKLVKGGNSPDGRFVIGEMFVGPTTETYIGIITADKKTVLCNLQVRTSYQLDKPHDSYLTVLWSPDSRMVAIHDSLDKYSVLHVYRKEGEKFTEVKLPDLQSEGSKRILRGDEKLISSGQLPWKWKSMDLLTVMFRATIADKGEKETIGTYIFLTIPSVGEATVARDTIGLTKRDLMPAK